MRGCHPPGVKKKGDLGRTLSAPSPYSGVLEGSKGGVEGVVSTPHPTSPLSPSGLGLCRGLAPAARGFFVPLCGLPEPPSCLLVTLCGSAASPPHLLKGALPTGMRFCASSPQEIVGWACLRHHQPFIGQFGLGLRGCVAFLLPRAVIIRSGPRSAGKPCATVHSHPLFSPSPSPCFLYTATDCQSFTTTAYCGAVSRIPKSCHHILWWPPLPT